MLNPKMFIDRAVGWLRNKYSNVGRVLALVSGGVDSTTSAVIAYKALGEKVKPVFINTGLMRMNEDVKVKEALKDLIPLEVVDRSGKFYENLKGLSDAEEKRKVFRDTFYRVVGELVNELGCDYVVQGTIAADWVETLGGIKTQHNVLTNELMSRYGFKVIEPLRELYKDQVRIIAKYLGIPNHIISRQPFPGPGLLVRTVSRFTLEKLEIVRTATEVVEEALASYGISQYFPAIWEYEISNEGRLCKDVCLDYKVFKVKATGVKGSERVYKPVVLVEDVNDLDMYSVFKYFNNLEFSHIISLVSDRGHGKYFISLRAVMTENYMTADVFRISQDILRRLAEELNTIRNVRAVGYDITPKPPATIEYE